MPRTIRNQFEKKLSYENLMKAHNLSKRGKGYRKEIILFNLKQEEYIMWLYEQLKNETYKHGGYTEFYVTEPKVRMDCRPIFKRILRNYIYTNSICLHKK